MTDPVCRRDVRSLAELKAKGAVLVAQARRLRRPILITLRGRGVAVVIGLEEYERMREELAFGRAVDEGALQARLKRFATPARVARVLGDAKR